MLAAPFPTTTPYPTKSGLTRRNILVGMSAAGALAAAGWPAAANAATGDKSVTITIMGTSDLHSNVVNWDYYKDADVQRQRGQRRRPRAGRRALVNQIRAERGREHTLLFDAGDTIQGTPLGFYYATVEPVTETGAMHPMAAQMNAIDYDAVALGNHEFNYGLDFLRQLDLADGRPGCSPRTRCTPARRCPRTRRTRSRRMKVARGARRSASACSASPTRVSSIWDKANVEGKLECMDLVETAAKWVPVMRAARRRHRARVRARRATAAPRRYGPDLPIENAAALVAEQVPGIDAILFGHAHRTSRSASSRTPRPASRCCCREPKNWGQRLTRLRPRPRARDAASGRSRKHGPRR